MYRMNIAALARRWPWVALAIALATLATALSISLSHDLRDEATLARNASVHELKVIVSYLSSALKNNQARDVERVLRELGEANPAVVYLQLNAADGTALGIYQRPDRRTTKDADGAAEHYLALDAPVEYPSRGGATLHLRTDLTPIYLAKKRLVAELTAIFATVAALLAALLHVTLVHRRDAAQLRRQTRELDAVNRGIVRSEERLRFALNAGQMGIFDRDVVTGDIVWSEQQARLFDMNLEDFDGRYETFARRVYPADLARVETAVNAARGNRSVYYCEYRIVWRDQSIHWVASQGKFFYGPDGRALRMTGVTRDISMRKRTTLLLNSDKKILELIANGAPLNIILEALARDIEELAGDTLCSVLLLDADGVHLAHGAAPSLPAAYTRAIDGQSIGPRAGSCGTAVFRRQAVIVSDIATDPLWDDYRTIALQHGLRACWSTPIRSISNQVLGSFALYYREPRAPTPPDFDVIEHATHLAGIAISRKNAETAVRDSEERFRAMFEQAAVGMALVAPYGRALQINNKLCDILGYTPSELLTRSFKDIALAEDLDSDIEYMRSLLSGDISNYAIEKRYVRKDGSLIWAHLTVGLVRAADGTPKYFVAIVEDISTRKQAEHAVHRLTHELEQRVAARTAELVETNAELETFSYTVSHDLRAPLRAVQGLAQALQEDYADELAGPGREYTARLVAAAERMDALIQDLLFYSRLTHAELRFEPTDLNTVVDRAQEQLALDIAKSGASVHVRRPLPTVIAHAATLTQVVINLLANAIKFVADGVRPIVTVRAEPRDGFIRVWFDDNGIGVDAEHRERIFRVFERLHGIETYPGTGIGLAIVRKGMERMGGAVGVEPVLGQGSRFWIELAVGGENL